MKNAPIILLDEATASLDVENETLIQTALSRLIKDKTVIVIAHRMRTVENADKIVVLSDGKLPNVTHRISLCKRQYLQAYDRAPNGKSKLDYIIRWFEIFKTLRSIIPSGLF